jgi:hypothetical protein
MDNNRNKLVIAVVFIIIIMIIGLVAVLGNGGYNSLKGQDGIDGTNGINGIDFNATIPHIFLFNGTQGVVSASLPLVYDSGTKALSINTLSYSNTNFADQNLLTSSSPTFSDVSLFTNANNLLSYTLQRTGSYAVNWEMCIHAGQITLQWDIGASRLMNLDTSGNLIVSGLSTANGFSNSNPAITNSNPWLGSPTTSRAIGTIYHNTNNYAIIVYITIYINGGVGSESNYNTFYLGFSSSFNAGNVVGYVTNSLTIAQDEPFTFIVPAGWYYEVQQALGTSAIDKWAEAPLG